MGSFRNSVYYSVKPLIPSRLRLGLRQWYSRRRREEAVGRWPALPGSETPPENWAGWPKGKQFALLLTHDVEGPLGLAKCRPLMELEMKLGFRSSYNFIPEGPYSVPATLRQELTANGFEVGVHDLHHDGKLYRERRRFLRKAERINDYLEQWGAVGFRSGFMLHNLDWIQDLNILYDSSTFDTDPFEPQPEGAGTIFPFWVPRQPAMTPGVQAGSQAKAGAGFQAGDISGLAPDSSGGYVELPYTLCQDSTIFLLLREQTPAIWLQKLEWIVSHGGMVLLNTHPDYMKLNGMPCCSWEYPVNFYERFLQHVRSKYDAVCWHVTPRELAAWFKETLPGQDRAAARSKRSGVRCVSPSKKVCMLTYSVYENDNRVSRYARELARRGDIVEVFALKSAPDQPTVEYLDGVKVHRLFYRSRVRQKSRVDFLLPIVRFLLDTTWRVAWRHSHLKYDLLHVHNVPDFLVFAASLPRLTGAKVILDIHDILPEFYASKFNLDANSFGVKLLKKLESFSARVAHHVILSNHLWLDKYAPRTGKGSKCSCFINNVDTRVFRLQTRTRTDGRLIVLYPGGLQSHQGLNVAISAFVKVSAEMPQAELHIYGDGNVKQDLINLCSKHGLQDHVFFFAPLPGKQIVEVIANADVGVVPKLADSFGNEAYSTKIMEFMSLGVPVVASSTKIDRFYFNESQVSFFKSGDPEDLAQALLQMLRDPELRRRQVANALKYVALHNWDSRRIAYLKLVDLLIAGDGGLDDLPPDPLDSRVSPQTFVDEAERESLTVRL